MEEEKSQKVVETYKAVAAGLASVLAALFTSRLGVAGTLIGTALTAITITLGSALLKVQLMKATDTISGLPSAVQGRLSTQQVRMPGRPSAEPNPEPARRGRLSSLLSRLRALPGFLRELPSNQRRKMLLAGLLAGLVATVIGLSTVTGIELVGGNTLSCLVWSCSEDDSEGSSGSSRRSGLSIFGGYAATGSPSTETRGVPPVDPSAEQPVLPGNDQPFPQGEKPNAPQPEQPDAPSQPGTPQQPDDASPRETPDPLPKETDPSQPGAEEPALDKDDDEAKPQPSDSQQGLRKSTRPEATRNAA